ncbi:hypothetical protein [Nocardiopsis synnemataformans]|uniref:hypothetical protein n=1 Tax=Nocardiopsis synnemataformans TaxID=61305 RepID=UPI003EB88782
MLIASQNDPFSEKVMGTWGAFDAPAGRVEYIMTKARLGKQSNDPERRLTKSLRPVREIMEAKDLDFNQLLQRDLDDHRVATGLIPYLLEKRATGPAFFPPIMAVLLPFEDNVPSRFPSGSEIESVTDMQAQWRQEQFGDAYQVRRMVDNHGHPHSINLAQLRWNYAEAKLVVLDGQHRAMALLAIERTMSRTWRGGSGEKFASFYEDLVNDYLKNPAVSNTLKLEEIEVPVTVCWFPDLVGPSQDPHSAARKLFVDVNKEAKAPSESRIILLSDAELVNVLTRSLLSELRTRDDDNLLPLYAVEYDNPDTKNYRPARWSVMTNIHLLKSAVERCVFGPSDNLTDVKRKFSGRSPKEVRNAFMRVQLDIETLFEPQFEDGGIVYNRLRIGGEEFPAGRVDEICQRFTSTWGKAILTLLSSLDPYAAHARALTRMRKEWNTVEPFSALARDALFGGVGVYWTLKDSHDHFEYEKKNLGQSQRKGTEDVLRAWGALDEKEKHFELLRAEEYLGSNLANRRDDSKSAFAVLNTHACQLGLFLTLGTLWEHRKKSTNGWSIQELGDFSNALTNGLNAFFRQTGPNKTRKRDRRLAFSKNVEHPINVIKQMETARAVLFRYFWLQALSNEESWSHISAWLPDRSSFESLVTDAREMYLDYCSDEQLKALKTSTGKSEDKDIAEEARTKASQALRKSLEYWFFIPNSEYDAWLSTISSKSVRGSSSTPEHDHSPNESEDGSSINEELPITYEEMLNDEED